MNSFGAQARLNLAGESFEIFRLDALEQHGLKPSRLPYSLRILLENLLRKEDGISVKPDDIVALGSWDAKAARLKEISFSPARVLLQDFTGVPCIVDLAAMRDAMALLDGDPAKINPLQPVELVIDHSVQVDAYGSDAAIQINLDLEFERNRERYQFLKWGQMAFDNFKVVPPNTGICHQVNLEYLARCVFVNPETGQAYPDTLVGTDSHTTMINGLGVLGWGVGGIEAEAAMLGQPISMLIPQVVGVKLTGRLRHGSTATDLVLTVTEMLRKHGVVGKFVEFYGPGIANLSIADRATIGNMSPEYGATCGIFPMDEETLRYLRFTARPDKLVDVAEAYMKEQGLFHTPDSPEPEYSSSLSLDLATVEASVAGPKRPQDRVALSQARKSFHDTFAGSLSKGGPGSSPSGKEQQPKPDKTATAVMEWEGPAAKNNPGNHLDHGSVVIAAITSCTNTSNPSVMVAAGLLARNAAAKGLRPMPWVKTSMAPGSRVVTHYLEKSGLLDDLETLGFNVVGYGCTTCIGNSGPLPEEVSRQIAEKSLVVCSVLSGNRNFEGRVNQEVKANYLMSPPLVVAYALAGTIETDLAKDPLGLDYEGNPVLLKDIWPEPSDVEDVVREHIQRPMFEETYKDVFEGDDQWKAIPVTGSSRYEWSEDSTYVKKAPYFSSMTEDPPTSVEDLKNLTVLAMLGDSITTDHISPAGAIKVKSPAGEYLIENGVPPHLFNSYGSRRGNHEVMMRGTFANVRLHNLLAPQNDGGFTTYLPTGEVMTIYDAAMRYKADDIGLLILAGKEYGSGSSRDWAAKGPALLGVKAVIAESFERIHRSNLVGMGIVPLEFETGKTIASLKLTGHEKFSISGLRDGLAAGFDKGRRLEVEALREDGSKIAFGVNVRIDTPREEQYYRHGGILQYVLRQLLRS